MSAETAAMQIGPVPTQVSVLIARLARVVRHRLEQVLTPTGLRQRHVVALSYLRGFGPTAQQSLAERLRMDPSSLVCLLNDLEEAGLVLRTRDRSDRRRAIVQLSPDGERALREVDDAVEAVEREMLTDLDADERTTLRRLLARLPVAGEWALADGE
jgi:MarR family transcriptional regulator, lower aerobic nicotinate degradation pathway regulator